MSSIKAASAPGTGLTEVAVWARTAANTEQRRKRHDQSEPCRPNANPLSAHDPLSHLDHTPPSRTDRRLEREPQGPTGMRIQVSCDTSVMKVSTSGRPIRLGVDGGEVRLRQDVARTMRAVFPVSTRWWTISNALAPHRRRFRDRSPPRLSARSPAPLRLVVVVARDADRFDQAYLEFARHDRGRHQPAAPSRAHDRLERARRRRTAARSAPARSR